MRHKNELKEEIAGLEATQQRKVQRRSALGQGTAIRNEDLRKAFEDERIKNIKLNKELQLQSITSPETVFTNKQSLARLNGKFGLTVSLDKVFIKVIHLLKYPDKYPAFFIQPETEPKVRRIRRRRRIRTNDRWNNEYA